MPVSPLPGNVRYRAFQLGLQSVFGTTVAATRRMPYRFTPTVDPHWTTPDVDTGTLDVGISPYRAAIDVTGQAVGPLAYNDAQHLYLGLLKGNVSPTGAVVKLWDIQPASLTADDYDIFTGQWGDEVAADQFQYQDGIIDQLQLEYPQDLGPVMVTADWRFSKVTYPSAMTSGLSVDREPKWVYAADTRLYIDSAAGSIGISPLVNSMHGVTVTIAANTDVKRFANGSNVNFNAAGYGRGARTLETAFTFAKSTPALVEAANWLNAAPQERFVVLDSTSRQFITGTTPFTHKLYFAGYWFTRAEAQVGGNTAFQLVCRGVYDTNLLYAIRARIENAAATALPSS